MSIEHDIPKRAVYLSENKKIAEAREKQFSKPWIKEPFTLVVAGDLMLTRPLSDVTRADVKEVIDLFKNSDCAITNLESNLVDIHNDPHVGGLQGSHELAGEVKKMGFDMVCHASNWATNQGTDVCLQVNHLLREAGVVVAGAGANLEDARAPQFYDTPKGRVGLVAMVPNTARQTPGGSLSASAGMQMASYGANNRSGLPGMNQLRVTPNYIISQEQFDMLKSIKDADQEMDQKLCAEEEFPYEKRNSPQIWKGKHNLIAPERKRLKLGKTWFEVGDNPGMIHYDMDEDDFRQIMRSVRQGKEWSDLMVFATHNGGGPGTRASVYQYNNPKPADFMVELAHAAIDNGADVFLGHGPQSLMGIEIYKNRPIFYGLNSCLYQIWGCPVGPDRYTDNYLDYYYTETTEAEFDMAYWGMSILYKNEQYQRANESIIPELKYGENGILEEIVLNPITFGCGREPISQVGNPFMANDEQGISILKRMQYYSAQNGIKIDIEGYKGYIRLQH